MAEFDYKEFARQMRENAVKDENGTIRVSPELWEQIASVIESIGTPKERGGEKALKEREKE